MTPGERAKVENPIREDSESIRKVGTRFPHPEHEENGLGWKVGTHVVYHMTNGSGFEGVDVEGMHGVVVSVNGAVLFADGEVRTPLPWNLKPLDTVDQYGNPLLWTAMTCVSNKFMPKPGTVS